MSLPGDFCIHHVPVYKRCRLCEALAQGLPSTPDSGVAAAKVASEPSSTHPRLGAILSRSKPLSLLATEMRINAGLDRAAISRALKAVTEIHALMSGAEWSSDTASQIAEILERHGWHIDEPLDLDNLELMHEVRCADGSTELVSTEELMAASGIFDRMRGDRR
jgi:hypothetical protein